MTDTAKICLGKASQLEAEQFKSLMAKSSIEVALVHNASTCSKGCSIQLEIWAHPDDLPAIQETLTTNKIKSFEDQHYNPDLLDAVFDPEAEIATCPACATSFKTSHAECPECGLRFF